MSTPRRWRHWHCTRAPISGSSTLGDCRRCRWHCASSSRTWSAPPMRQPGTVGDDGGDEGGTTVTHTPKGRMCRCVEPLLCYSRDAGEARTCRTCGVKVNSISYQRICLQSTLEDPSPGMPPDGWGNGAARVKIHFAHVCLQRLLAAIHTAGGRAGLFLVSRDADGTAVTHTQRTHPHLPVSDFVHAVARGVP